LAFAGTGDAFVKTWYDQSGNSNDATQTNTANQPRIVSSGAVEVENGKPIMTRNSNNTSLNLTTLSGSSCSCWMVVKGSFTYNVALSVDNNEIWFMQQVNTDSHTLGMGTPSYYINGSSFTGTSRTDLRTALQSSQSLINAFDLDLSDAVWTRLGWQYSIPAYDMQEVLIWESNQSTNRTGIENNLNTFYSIY